MVKVLNGPHRGYDLSQLTLDHLFEIAGRHESEFQMGLKAAILEELHRRDAEAAQQLRHRVKGGSPPRASPSPATAEGDGDTLGSVRPTLTFGQVSRLFFAPRDRDGMIRRPETKKKESEQDSFVRKWLRWGLSRDRALELWAEVVAKETAKRKTKRGNAARTGNRSIRKPGKAGGRTAKAE